MEERARVADVGAGGVERQRLALVEVELGDGGRASQDGPRQPPPAGAEIGDIISEEGKMLV